MVNLVLVAVLAVGVVLCLAMSVRNFAIGWRMNRKGEDGFDKQMVGVLWFFGAGAWMQLVAIFGKVLT